MGNRLSQFIVLILSLGSLLIYSSGTFAQNETIASKQNSSLLVQAQGEFSQRHYVEALQLYRNYLRSYPDDQDAWTRFAATYYHTGQAKQALNYLQKAKPSSKLKAFSLFYQALCYDATGDRLRAKRLLARVAKLEDSLAEDALFELAALEFEDADVGAARAAAEDYLKRFREGRFRSQVEIINNRLALAGKIDIEGSQHARYRSSFFEHHPLSLIKFPHIWYYQLAYRYNRGARSNPDYGRSKPVVVTGINFEEFKLNANAGFGLGPFKGKGTESYAGYIYEQDWLSDGDRLKVWSEDPLDIQYFPFRPDLLERRHRLYVETFGQSGDFFLGVYAHTQFHRAGSKFFPAPERPEIRKAFDIAAENLVVPWVEWNYNPQHSLRTYLLFQKFINREQNNFSYKTYSFFNNVDTPFLSLTLEHNSSLPEYAGLKLKMEAFQHQYLYNDFWEGYTSRGAAGQIRLSPWSFLTLGAKVSFAIDSYTYDQIRSHGCGDGGEDAVPAACPRIDKTLISGISASYITSKQQALSLMFNYRSHKNDTFREYEESQSGILLQFTQAFPTLNQAGRYIEPFQGIAGSKGVY